MSCATTNGATTNGGTTNEAATNRMRTIGERTTGAGTNGATTNGNKGRLLGLTLPCLSTLGSGIGGFEDGLSVIGMDNGSLSRMLLFAHQSLS